jgi:hypothetical protein
MLTPDATPSGSRASRNGCRCRRRDSGRHVLAGGERRLADPVRALAAHLGEAGGVAVHPLPCSGSRCRHRRASPPAPRSRCCAGSRSRNRACAWRLSCASASRPCALAISSSRRAQRRIVLVLQQRLRRARSRHVVGVERAMDREQPLAVARPLADHHRLALPSRKAPRELDLDQRALLLDDHDRSRPAAKALSSEGSSGQGQATLNRRMPRSFAGPRRCRGPPAPGARRDRICRP